MADTTRIEVIPLTPGVREDTDRTTAPLGTLIEAVNARWRRGGIGKANGLTAAGTNTQVGSYGTAYDGLGFANGLQASLMDGRAFVRRALGDEWKEAGRSSRYLPVKTHWIAFDESSSAIDHYSCAVINTTLAVAYTRFGTTDSAVLVLMDALTGAVRDTAIKEGRRRGGVVACGSNFAWVYSGDTGALYRVSVPATSDSIDTSGETQIGTSATLLAANTVFDVAEYSSASFLLAWRVTNTAVSVSRILNSDASIPNFQNVTCDNTALSSITVFGTSGEPVWCAFDDAGVNGFKVAKFSANVAGTDNGVASFADGQGGDKAGFTRVSGTIARLTWVEAVNNSSTPTQRFRSGTVSGNTVTADTLAYHFMPASAPFAASPHSTNNTTGQYSVWVHTDSGTPFQTEARTGAWAVQRKYLLTTPSTHNSQPGGIVASGQFVPGVELAPDERATNLQSRTVPVVAERTHGAADGYEGKRYYFPARVVLRTQDAGGLDPTRTLESSALVIYEIEAPGSSNTSDARARQVAELGGRSLVLGGHVQELYTQTPNGLRAYTDSGAARQAKLGTENGFAFSPAILDANATAGSGLTADARYSFCATFEYITPDGQRTQSAPSNIVEVTPSGNNCQVTVRVSSGPKTEREVISPPNRVIVHLYATTGDGNTFQRVTPDSSGYLAIPSTGNGDFITIVHTAADTATEDNEPLYTDTGELANQPGPAHRFGWVGGGRLVLAGLFDRTLVEMSKPPRANTPIEFTRLPQFRTQLPEAVTGGAFLDNAHVIFTKTGIYLLQGPFPDDKGAPSLATPVRLPSVVGCIDYRSVYEIAEGLVFQSARGVELLPRGFGPPRLLSEPMQNALRGRKIISVTAATHGGSVRAGPTTKTGQRMLYMSALAFGGGEDGIRLVYDLDAGRWISTDTPVTSGQGEYLTTWDGKLAVAPRALNTLFYEDPEAWIDGTMTLTIADARPFSAMGRGMVHRFQLLGEYRAAASVALSIYLDGVYSAPVSLGSLPVTGTAGDKFLLEWQMKGSERKVSAFGARIVVTGNTNSTEDLVLHSLSAEVTGLAGRPRVRQNRSG